MSKINIKWSNLLLIPLIFLFLPAFCIPLGLVIPVYYLLIYIIFVPFMIYNYKQVYHYIIRLCKKTPSRWLVYFSIWVLFDFLCLLLLNKITIIFFLSSFIIILLGSICLCYLYPAYIINRYFSTEKIFQFLCIALFFVFIWGIITFLGELLNIHFLQLLENIISNRQFIRDGVLFKLIRARSSFFEPGIFAYFIVLNLPLFFYINKCKYKIFNNKNLNFVIKKAILPLAFLNLILTFSPIGWFFGICITLFYHYKNILKIFVNKQLLVKTLLIISILVLFLYPQYKNIAENTAVKRISAVISNVFKDIEILTIVEPSLYTRIVSYTNSFCLFLQHPVLGVGLDNSKFIIMKQFENSPIILSKENEENLQKSYITGKMAFNRNILCDLLCETGFLGCTLMYIFMLKLFFSLKKITKHSFNFEREFIKVISDILLMTICLSFYESTLTIAPYHFFIFALSNVLILKNQKYIRRY